MNIMRILAVIAFIWVLCLAIGAAFHILGSIIWLAILGSAVYFLYEYLNK